MHAELIFTRLLSIFRNNVKWQHKKSICWIPFWVFVRIDDTESMQLTTAESLLGIFRNVFWPVTERH